MLNRKVNFTKMELIKYYFKDFKKYFIFLTIVVVFWLATHIASIFLLQEATNAFSKNHSNIENVLFFCGILIFVYVLSSFLQLLINEISIKVSYKIESHLSMLVINKLRYLPMKYFDINKSGEIFTKTLSDPSNVQNGLVNFYIEFNKMIFGGVGFGVALLVVSPYIALIGFVCFFGVMCLNIYFFKRSMKLTQLKRKALGEINAFMEEMINGQNVIENFNQQNFILKKYDEINNRLYKDWVKSQFASGMIFPWSIFSMRLMNTVVIVAYLLFSIAKIPLPGIVNNIDPISGAISFGGLVSVSLFSNFFADFFTMLGNTIPIFILARTSLAKIHELVSNKNEQDWNENLKIDSNNGIKVEFKNVVFNYDENQPTLKNINFVAKKNQKIAIIGPTGAGKTTITNLINKFYDINAGDILFNNESIINKSRTSVRNHISIVLQDTFLFGDSIFKNILNGNPKASEQDVVEAAKKAQIHDFISELKNGYQTIIDEKHNFSQGQKQLISIARAIISDAKIIILDEATSSIDSETEIKINKAIDNLLESRTSFIVAHKLSTIINADLILVVKDGEIIASGTHEELIKSSSFYKNLYEANYKTNVNN